MPPLEEASQPCLSAGCRVQERDGVATLLFPEGAIKLQGTALSIVQLCDGTHTLAAMVTSLIGSYAADPHRIRADAVTFLEKLHNRRIVDY